MDVYAQMSHCYTGLQQKRLSKAVLKKGFEES